MATVDINALTRLALGANTPQSKVSYENGGMTVSNTPSIQETIQNTLAETLAKESAKKAVQDPKPSSSTESQNKITSTKSTALANAFVNPVAQSDYTVDPTNPYNFIETQQSSVPESNLSAAANYLFNSNRHPAPTTDSNQMIDDYVLQKALDQKNTSQDTLSSDQEDTSNLGVLDKAIKFFTGNPIYPAYAQNIVPKGTGLQIAKDYLDTHWIGSDGRVHTQDAQGNDQIAAFVSQKREVDKYNEYKDRLKNASQEELLTAFNPGALERLKEKEEIKAASKMTDDEADLRRGGSKLQAAIEIFNKDNDQVSLDKASHLTDAEKQMRRGTAEIFNNTMAFNGNPNGYSIDTLEKKAELAKKQAEDSNPFKGIPNSNSLRTLATDIANNRVPNSATYEQLKQDLKAHKRNIVSNLSATGKNLGSLDDVIFAVDNQNLGADAVVDKITSSAKDLSFETRSALIDLVNLARQKFPSLPFSAIGSVMKLNLTNGELGDSVIDEHVTKNIQKITENLNLRKGNFYKTLKSLATDKTNGFAQIELKLDQAQADLIKLASLETAYTKANTSYSNMIANTSQLGDKSPYKRVQAHIDRVKKQAFDDANTLYNEATGIVGMLTQRYKKAY